MMKRTMSLMLTILLILPVFSLAIAEEIDLLSYTDDELYGLYMLIQQEAQSRFSTEYVSPNSEYIYTKNDEFLKTSDYMRKYTESAEPIPDNSRLIDIFPDKEFSRYLRDRMGLPSINSPINQNMLDEITYIDIWMAASSENYHVQSLEGIGHLRALVRIALRNPGNITVLPDEIGQCKQLIHLDIRGIGITHLPDSIRYLPYLKSIDLSACDSIIKLPEWIGELKNPQTLILYDSDSIVELPESFGNLSSLIHLDIHGTSISALPKSFCNLISLRELDLSKTNITQFPPELLKLTGLLELNLSNTRINSLPAEISSFHFLQKLYLNNTLLTALPEEICTISTIEKLDISNTSIDNNGFPFELYNIPGIEIKITNTRIE